MRLFRPAFLALLASPALSWGGGLVVDRATLNGLLGSSGYTETFEGLNFASTQAFSGINVLNSSTILASQGPNLVAPGVEFSGTTLQLDLAGYYSAPSKEILFNGSTITIDFTGGMTAFGVDVRDFSGYSLTMSVTIYATDDTTVLNTFTGISVTHPPTFFGYQDAGGIGRVVFASGGGWSPIIDNLAFSPVPEPSTLLLLGAGLATLMGAGRRRRTDSGA